jgi:pimeloyl-ACP methyl ester carboxylesterase
LQRFEPLPLASFESATVAVPLGARAARPVVIALHGQFDSVSADCNAWSSVTDYSYFVLCPALRSKPSADRPAQDCTNWECAAAELKEALVALRKRFGSHVAPKEVMLAGVARGAALAVPIAQQDPAVFSRLWLVDGGHDAWSSVFSATYVARGGKLLAVACTQAVCQDDAQRVLASARAVGLEVADYRSLNGNGHLTPSLSNSLKATWQTVRPKRRPWALPPSEPGPTAEGTSPRYAPVR